MIKIIADSKIPFLKGVLDEVAEVRYLPGTEIRNEHLKDADALIVRTRTKCNEQLLENTAVKYIATSTIGYDHLDIDYLDKKGIKWSNAPGCNSGSVMQYIASALANIVSVNGKSLGELSLGIIGVGHVGKKVEHLARVLGMDVLLNDPPRERMEGNGDFVDVDRLLRDSDIVTIHVPLNRTGQERTLHLANEAFFGKMQEKTWFINTSRGEVTDTPALIRALSERYLSGAILDVWQNEPHIDRGLLELSSISTPHIAGYSLDGKANGTSESVRAVSRFFGLGMEEWYPDNIPPPEREVINIESKNQGREQVINEIFFHTYNIKADSLRLKSDPGSFEQLRDDYPSRREFGAYTLNFEYPSDNINDILRKLGFNY